jgi:hypothetical protein
MHGEMMDDILKKEWAMFVSVKNEGGPASCQEDQKTFNIMRSSQFKTFPAQVLKSYLSDLKKAEREGRNLMTEKYARMMKYTVPERYEAFEHLLPEIDPASRRLIEELVSIFMEWHAEFDRAYPRLSALGRPGLSGQDTASTTSSETYLRGELETYSAETLGLYHDFVVDRRKNSVNLVELTVQHTAEQYGYQSLGQADDALRGARKS